MQQEGRGRRREEAPRRGTDRQGSQRAARPPVKNEYKDMEKMANTTKPSTEDRKVDKEAVDEAYSTPWKATRAKRMRAAQKGAFVSSCPKEQFLIKCFN